LHCPAGAILWLQEQRQETPYAQRLVFCAPLEACQPCHLREPCLGRGAQGNRARRVSAVRRLLPLSRSPCQREGTLLAIRWVDLEGAKHPPTLDQALAHSSGGGSSPLSEAGETIASCSTGTPGSSPSALELERTARPQCLVGSSTRAPAPLRGRASPDFSVEAKPRKWRWSKTNT
jgi:hypothetical protein